MQTIAEVKLTNFELLARGIEVLKSMIDNTSIGDKQFHSKYGNDLMKLRSQTTQESPLPDQLLSKVCAQKLQPTSSLQE